ncbi:MAG: ABC transporter ATP-binding protein [Clostridia bacterium]|nr:ABC transporter ATP-binding protein [Clostridia bacterium]
MIKKLLGCVREYKKPSVLAPVYVTFEVLLEVLIPFLMAKLVDLGINGNNGQGDFRYIVIVGIVLIVLCALSLWTGVLAGKYAAIASAGFAKNLRKDMFHNVQNFSFSNIDKFSTSGIVTRLTTDVTHLQHAYQMIIRIAVRSPMMLVFSLIMAFTVKADLAMIFLAAVPVLGIGLYFIMTHAHPIFERVFKTYDKLNNVVQENLRGVRVVKAYVREQHEEEKFNGVSTTIYSNFLRAERLLAWNAPLMQFCMYGCMLFISWVGANLIVAETMTTGELMSVMTYVMQILSSLMMVSMIFVMLTISRTAAERTTELLNETSDITNPQQPVFHVQNGEIIFKKVDFSYAGDSHKLCLSDVDLTIQSGETVGILGGTGSAKTTLVQLIPRLYDVTDGELLVGGVNVKDYDLDTLRNEVAMVLQKNVLFSGTIKENLRWGNENATDEEMIHACQLAQADGFINEFPDGYDTFIEQGGSNVSGGQKQRLCIARALLKKPKILILDDSTSAVDTHTDALIRKAFLEEIPDTTKIIIAQRVSSIMEADKIIVMDDGKISGIGTHETLLNSNEIYRDVYESQTKGGISDVAK